MKGALTQARFRGGCRADTGPARLETRRISRTSACVGGRHWPEQRRLTDDTGDTDKQGEGEGDKKRVKVEGEKRRGENRKEKKLLV